VIAVIIGTFDILCSNLNSCQNLALALISREGIARHPQIISTAEDFLILGILASLVGTYLWEAFVRKLVFPA